MNCAIEQTLLDLLCSFERKLILDEVSALSTLCKATYWDILLHIYTVSCVLVIVALRVPYLGKMFFGGEGGGNLAKRKLGGSGGGKPLKFLEFSFLKLLQMHPILKTSSCISRTHLLLFFLPISP